MKKLAKFLHTVPMKLYVLLAAILLFTFFSNDFGLVDIQKTAVILAAGVDRTEEGYHVTTQIAVPKGSERTSCGTACVNIEGDGETVSDCIAQIYTKTGWVPKFIFCNLILLGEDTAKEDVFGGLDFFLRNEYMQDNCFVAACEGTAREMLTSTSAIEDTTTLAVTKLFSDAAIKTGKVVTSTLKEFAIGYYGVSESGYMPFVRAQDQDCGASSGGGEGSQASGSKGGEESGSSEKGQEQKKIYTADETAIFSQGKMAALLSRRETFAFNLLQGKIFAGTFTVTEGEKPVTVTILKNEGGVSLDMKNKPKATFSVELLIKLHNKGLPSPINDVSDTTVPDEILESATEEIRGYLTELWNTCQNAKCDLFHLNRNLYRSSLKKYEEWKEHLLNTVEVSFQPKVKSIR